jgi:hypothetical protein
LKALRHNKAVGLAIGERSLLAAEMTAGEPPQARRLAEFIYPPGTSLDQPAELGEALGQFLREKDFSARCAVIGLPARWLVVKAKEVPPADASTLADLLRLQAEGEFSSELKDLVYDYAGGIGEGGTASVLLIATHRKYVDGVVALCEAAKLDAVAITSSAVALGAATGRALVKTSLVLAISPSGAELTAQSGESLSAIRHLRGPSADRPFIGELRRALSTTASNGSPRELVLWDDSGLDAGALGKDLGFNVQSGDLPALGVGTMSAAKNGDGRKFAAAVALGLAGIGQGRPVVDFLHSRLAPVKRRLVPRWAWATAAAVVLLIGGAIYTYNYLQQQQASLDAIQNQLAGAKNEIATATEFVSKVSFASAWHGGSPRYLACLRDLTAAIPEDGETYATSLIVRENVKPPSGGSTGGSNAVPKANEITSLTGLLYGKTSDQQRVQGIIDRMNRMPALFRDVKLGGSDAGRGHEVSFSISFTYVPSPS